ncbi:MAG: glycosyltransferase family 4 protein [Methanosphaera sp.]|nr:glycosyltransferase family 4 protein [Methanosphaera sp.]
MKICMVLEFFLPYYNGGGEHRYYELAKRVVKTGHTIDLLTMKTPDGDDHEVIEGINVYQIGPTINNPPIRSVKDFIQYFFSVTRWLLTHNYDLIDAQSYSPLISSVICAKLKRTPIIGTIHDVSTNNTDQWVQSSKLANMAETMFARLPYTNLLTVSEATRNSLVENFGSKDDKTVVIYNGVDIPRIDSVECNQKDKNTILFVGRLIPHKHADDLLWVVNQLKDDIDNLKLVIVGRGIEKDKLLEYIDENHLEEYVEFMQDLSDEELTIQMKKANVLALPSTREGFGLVLSEANACHTPVVAYCSGGVVNVVRDEYNGFLIEPLDKVALKDKIELILTDKQLQKTMAENSYNHVVKNFDLDKLTVEYIELAQQLVNQ